MQVNTAITWCMLLSLLSTCVSLLEPHQAATRGITDSVLPGSCSRALDKQKAAAGVLGLPGSDTDHGAPCATNALSDSEAVLQRRDSTVHISTLAKNPADPGTALTHVVLSAWNLPSYESFIRRLRDMAHPAESRQECRRLAKQAQSGNDKAKGKQKQNQVTETTPPRLIAFTLPVPDDGQQQGQPAQSVKFFMWMVPMWANKVPAGSGKLYILGYTLGQGAAQKHYWWGKKEKENDKTIEIEKQSLTMLPDHIGIPGSSWTTSSWDSTVQFINYRGDETKVDLATVATAVRDFTLSPEDWRAANPGKSKDRRPSTAIIAAVVAEAVRFEAIKVRVQRAWMKRMPRNGIQQARPFSASDPAITDPTDIYYKELKRLNIRQAASIRSLRAKWLQCLTILNSPIMSQCVYVGLSNMQVVLAQPYVDGLADLDMNKPDTDMVWPRATASGQSGSGPSATACTNSTVLSNATAD